MFIKRALITFTLGPLALFLIYKGGLFYFLPITAVMLLATAEYTRLGQALGWHLSNWVLIPAVLLQLIAGQWSEPDLSAPLMAASLLVVLVYILWLYEQERSQTAPADWLVMMAGILFLGWLGSHFFRLRAIRIDAWQWTMLAMITTWVADSAAYVVGKFMAGRIMGKHPLSPRLSPNKTVEGYIGGILFGTGIALTLAHYFQLPFTPALILGLFISIIGPAGDLGISLLKREAGVKDSGHLFPGHGGALDRIDSLVWSVTMAYYLAVFVS
ncbi:MAG: phosphatidate cytidylyltransferase [Anaerolineae bacterium]